MWTWLLPSRIRPPKEFVDWCRSPIPKTSVAVKADEFLGVLDQRHRGKGTSEWRKTFYKQLLDEEILPKLRNRSGPFNILLNTNPADDDSLDIIWDGIDYANYISAFHLTNDGTKLLKVENLAIGHFHVKTNSAQLIIRNSDISRLDLHAANGVVLENCNVGTLGLFKPTTDRALHDLDISGGSILNIVCPSPWEESPFKGSISFSDNVFLPRNPTDFLITSAQPYRNIRSHLRRLENSQGANLFHAAELGMERKLKDSPVNKFFSIIYEYFSDYGSSTLRPLVWLLSLWLLSFLFIFVSDGASPVKGVDYSGWREILLTTDCYGRAWGALVLSLQQISSPLTILGAKTLLVAKYTWLAVWSVIHSLLSVVLIALFILAVRRRFKMQ